VYGIVSDASPAIQTYMFGDDLVITSSTLLHFGLLKSFLSYHQVGFLLSFLTSSR